MKKLIIAALLATPAPALAQTMPLQDGSTMRQSAAAFAGIRLRLDMAGARSNAPVRAGLVLAPVHQMRSADGSARIRFGEGLELGMTERRPVTLSIAGTPVDRLGIAPGERSPSGPRAGVSTLGWVAIGAGALLVVGLGVGYLVVDDVLDCDADEECN